MSPATSYTNAPLLIQNTNGTAGFEIDSNMVVKAYGNGVSGGTPGTIRLYETNGQDYIETTVAPVIGTPFENRSFTNRMGSPILGIPDKYLIVDEPFNGQAQTANLRGREPWGLDAGSGGGVTNALERGSAGIAQFVTHTAGGRASLVLGGIVGSEGQLLYATNCIFELNFRWKTFAPDDGSDINLFRAGLSYRVDAVPATGLWLETTNAAIWLMSRLNGGTQTRVQSISNVVGGAWYSSSIIFESSGTNALLYHGPNRDSMVCVATNGGPMPHNLGTTVVLGNLKLFGSAIIASNWVDEVKMWYLPMGSLP